MVALKFVVPGSIPGQNKNWYVLTQSLTRALWAGSTTAEMVMCPNPIGKSNVEKELFY